jgi:hypothetical protein
MEVEKREKMRNAFTTRQRLETGEKRRETCQSDVNEETFINPGIPWN